MTIAIFILLIISIFASGNLNINNTKISFNWISLVALILMIICLANGWYKW